MELTMEDVWDVIKQTCTCKKACSGILNSLKTFNDWLWNASKETVAKVYCCCYQGMGKIISSCTSWKQDAGSVVCRLTNKTCVWPRLLLCRKWHQDVLSCFVTWGSQLHQQTEILIPVIVFRMLAENIRRYPLFFSISLRKLCFIQQRISSKAPRSCSSLFLSITNLWIKSSSRRQKGPNSDFLLLIVPYFASYYKKISVANRHIHKSWITESLYTCI